MPPDSARVRLYHDATKHHFGRMARSSGHLDWATQPSPFRIFDGCRPVDLVGALEDAGRDPSGWRTVAFDRVMDGEPRTPMEPGLPAVSVFLRYSLGLSAWKRDAWSRWALRVNPSSGNLHPTEGYVLTGPGTAGPRAAVCHYRPDVHALEPRALLTDDVWSRLVAGLPPGSVLAALTSITWREAWKYGERAFRYCQHDTGHAMAAIRMAAAMIGWHVRLVAGLGAGDLDALLGTNRPDDFHEGEGEEPECLLAVTPMPCPPDWQPDPAAAEAVSRCDWQGQARQLSADRVVWDAIDDVAAATRGAVEAVANPSALPQPAPATRHSERPLALSRLALQRRSAVDMTGDSPLDLNTFCQLLQRLLPGSRPPWDALWWAARVHLVLFVHRVEGLDPGLYVLARRHEAIPLLRQAMRDDFLWAHPAGVPRDLPLSLLVPLDVRGIAAVLSCRQSIAADGYASVGMLAEFDGALEDHGAAFYRCLFWEAGMVGHQLYLEAEAAGARGTGIGCYFDDAVHDLLGIADHRLQSLYHFTIGQPVEDTRLQTEPGYGWEKD